MQPQKTFKVSSKLNKNGQTLGSFFESPKKTAQKNFKEISKFQGILKFKDPLPLTFEP
jgi:hypothetical protein